MNTNEAILLLAAKRDQKRDEADAIDLLISTARGFLTSEVIEEKLAEGDALVPETGGDESKPTTFEVYTPGE
jgi:hypothetical protein